MNRPINPLGLLAATVVLVAGCGSDAGLGELAFVPVRGWTLDGALTPLRASAVDEETVLFLGSDRRSVYTVSDHDPRLVGRFDSGLVGAIASDGRRLFAANGARVYELMGSGEEPHMVFEAEDERVITSLVVRGSTMWLVADGDLAADAKVLHLTGDRADRVSDLPVRPYSTAVLPWTDTAAMLLTETIPFSSVEVSEVGAAGMSFSARGEWFDAFVQERGPTEWRGATMIPIDDRLSILWANRLSSLERMALIIDRRTGEVVRGRSIEGPLGLVHKVPNSDLVLGSQELPGARQLILYRITEVTE